MADPFAADVVLDIRCMEPLGSDVVVDHAERHGVVLANDVVISAGPAALSDRLGLLTADIGNDPMEPPPDISIVGNMDDFDIIPYMNDRTIELEFTIPIGWNSINPDYLRMLWVLRAMSEQFEETYDNGSWVEDYYTISGYELVLDYNIFESVAQNVLIFTFFGSHYNVAIHDYDIFPYFSYTMPCPTAEGELVQFAISKARVGETEDVVYRFRLNDTWYDPAIDGELYAGTDFGPPQSFSFGNNVFIPS